MKGTSHLLGGIALGSGAFFATGSVLFALGAVIGSKSPDWLELPIRGFNNARISLFPHRTFTHWPFLWLLGTFWAIVVMDNYLQSVFLGFFLGGVIHLVQDSCTPMGVPVFLPLGERYSLRLVHGFVSEALVNMALLPVFFLTGLVIAKYVLV